MNVTRKYEVTLLPESAIQAILVNQFPQPYSSDRCMSCVKEKKSKVIKKPVMFCAIQRVRSGQERDCVWLGGPSMQNYVTAQLGKWLKLYFARTHGRREKSEHARKMNSMMTAEKKLGNFQNASSKGGRGPALYRTTRRLPQHPAASNNFRRQPARQHQVCVVAA